MPNVNPDPNAKPFKEHALPGMAEKLVPCLFETTPDEGIAMQMTMMAAMKETIYSHREPNLNPTFTMLSCRVHTFENTRFT